MRCDICGMEFIGIPVRDIRTQFVAVFIADGIYQAIALSEMMDMPFQKTLEFKGAIEERFNL